MREARTASEPNFLNTDSPTGCLQEHECGADDGHHPSPAHTHSEEPPRCRCSGGTEATDVETGTSMLFILRQPFDLQL